MDQQIYGSRLKAVIAEVDRQNSADPATTVVDGETLPLALAHGLLADRWVTELYPRCASTWRIAARAHHLRRWELRRSEYPEGRGGYLRWKSDQRKRHAEAAGELLSSFGLEDLAAEVAELIRRRNLEDEGCRAIEDAACLAFAETQLSAVTDALGTERTVEILRRTVAKMSERGAQAFLRLELPEGLRDALLADASASDTGGGL